MIHCVSTMDKPYYDNIGKLMIETWKMYFPENYVLHLYLEDMNVKINHPRIIIEDWNEVVKLFDKWDQRHQVKEPRRRKFTKKAMAEIAAWNKFKKGKMLWIDADIIFFKTIPNTLFDSVLSSYAIASWKADGTIFESGTVFINLDHPDFGRIKRLYEDIYVGDYNLPEGPRWFDGEILGWVVDHLNINYRNLTEHYKARTRTPLNKSYLGTYMNHYKGRKKDTVEEYLLGKNRKDLVNLYKSI